MSAILAQIRKELLQVVRDQLALALALALPVGFTALLGTTISLTVSDMPIVIQDLDQTPTSRRYADAFRASLTFRVVPLPVAASPEDPLRSGRARAALIIPQYFARDLGRRGGAEVQLLVDATDTNTALLVRGNAGQVTRAFAADVADPRPGSVVQARTRLWFNPGREPRKFFGPGMFVLALSIFPPLLAALAMAREGEQRTILQVYVSGIPAHQFLVGKILAGMTVGLLQWALTVGVMVTLFGLWPAGDPTPFVVASVLFLFCVVAFGTFVGAAIPSQAAAMQAIALGGFLLAFLLSGLIYPVENVPWALRWLATLVQARYFIIVVRDAFLQGGGWPAVWWAVLPIGVIGLAFYTLAWRTTRRMQVAS